MPTPRLAGAFRLARALLVLGAIAAWNAIVAHHADSPASTSADSPASASVDDPDVVEHERNWYDYLRGFHVHDGGEGHLPEHGSFVAGLLAWQQSNYLRGYTRGNDVYLCPNAPRVLRVHQAGHAPAFGQEFEPIATERRPDGGLDDEPLWTLDVMLPGDIPHTFVRLRDSRGLGETYDAWVSEGRIARR